MVEKKLVAAEVKALDTDNPNGEFLVTLSTPSLDRDGEIVDFGALDPLPDHISFDIDHGMSTATTVGSGRPFYDGDRLMVRGTWASTKLGQEVRTLVNEGHIRTASVAMLRPLKEKRDDGVHITKASLLNGAFVPVPANPDALVVASKALEAKAAIPSHDTATTDAAWDNNTQKTNLSNDAGAATYRKAYAWVDDDADPDLKGSYRFIHHMVSSDGSVGAANMTACSTGIGVLNGGRGGTVIPESGRKGVYNHLRQHLIDGGRDPDEVPELKSVGSETAITINVVGDVDAEEIARQVREELLKHERRNMTAINVKVGARNSTSDKSRLQIIHQNAAELLDLECASAGKHISPSHDTSGAGGDDEQQHLELRARALRLIAGTQTGPA